MGEKEFVLTRTMLRNLVGILSNGPENAAEVDIAYRWNGGEDLEFEQVVRCRDCVYYEPEQEYYEAVEVGYPPMPLGDPPTCHRFDVTARDGSVYTHDTKPDGYCHWGERRDER